MAEASLGSSGSVRGVLTSSASSTAVSSVGTPFSIDLWRRGGSGSGNGVTPRQYASPVLRTPAPGRSAVVALNDDAAERRQRRLDKQMRTMMSPGCHTPKNVTASGDPQRSRGIEAASSSLSNVQIADHYANCIKLSSQNKINAKNAFGLHLIDYMQEVLQKRGEMTNFQVAGCTLDASAKIYAGRVDSIYNDAYKMLGGLGSREPRAGGDGEENEEVEPSQGRRRGRKPATLVSQTIEKKPSSLEVDTFDLQFDVDPLFRKTSASFDEGGVEGLLLTHLCVRDDNCRLMLHGSETPPTSDAPMPAASMDIQELRGHIDLERMMTLEICPTFASFTFATSGSHEDWSWDNLLSSATPTKYSSDHPPQPIGAEYSVLDLPCDNGADPSTYDGDASYDAGAEDFQPTADGPWDGTVLGVCGDGEAAKVVTAIDPGSGRGGPVVGGVGELVLSEALDPSEYSYFKPAVLSAWAGPHHWKLRPRKRSTEESAEEEKKPKRRRVGIRRSKVDLSADPDKKLFEMGRTASQLSKAAVSRMREERNTLPCDTHTAIDSLLSVVSRPKTKVRRQKRLPGPVEEGFEGCWYDYGSAKDTENFCPTVTQEWEGDSDDGDGGEGVLGGEEAAPVFFDQDAGAFTMDVAAQPASQLLAGGNLVAQPRKVQQIMMNYAKTAKKLDVKRLKNTMWDIISEGAGHNAAGMEESDGGASDESPAPTSFRALCCSLPGRVSRSMAENASFPICFVCLLHLANERDLVLSGSQDLQDLSIALANTPTSEP